MVANIQNPKQGGGEQQIKFWVCKMIKDEIAQYSRSLPVQTDANGVIIVNENTGIQSSNYVAGTSGWRLNGTQIETHTSIAGFVNNVTVSCSARNFALTTTMATLASGTITVPAGYTQCDVVLLGQLYAQDPNTTGGSNTTGGDYIYCQATFNGYSSVSYPFGVTGNGGAVTADSFGSKNFTGLTPGSSIAYNVRGQTAYAGFAAATGNSAQMTCAILWAP